MVGDGRQNFFVQTKQIIFQNYCLYAPIFFRNHTLSANFSKLSYTSQKTLSLSLIKYGRPLISEILSEENAVSGLIIIICTTYIYAPNMLILVYQIDKRTILYQLPVYKATKINFLNSRSFDIIDGICYCQYPILSLDAIEFPFFL